MAICPSCGQSNADHALFCQSCGTSLGTETSDAVAPPVPEPQEAPSAEGVQYGGFWLRVVAAIIDAIVLGVVSGMISLATFGVGFGFSIVIPWLYEALMTASETQATLGKMALGLVVTDENRQRLTFARATGRHFAKYLSFLTLCVGFVMVAFTDRKQGLHDMVAGTLVIRSSRSF